MVDAVGPDNGSGASVGRRRSPSLPVGRGSSPPRHRTLRGDQNVLRLLLHGQTLLRGRSPQDGGHEGLVLGHGVLQGKVTFGVVTAAAAVVVAHVFGLTTALTPFVDAAGATAGCGAAAAHVVGVVVVLIGVAAGVGDPSLGSTDGEVVAVEHKNN